MVIHARWRTNVLGDQTTTVASLSSIESEYLAASDAVKEAMWRKNFINDLGLPSYHVDKVPLILITSLLSNSQRIQNSTSALSTFWNFNMSFKLSYIRGLGVN